jgi:formylmethanofuran dehydrogenase subunit B
LDKGVYIAQFNDKALEAAAAIGITPTRDCPYSAATMSNEAQLLMLRIAKDISTANITDATQMTRAKV